MVRKKDTINEVLTGLVRDLEKLKEKPKEDFAVFDGFVMAEQMEVVVSDTLSDPVEIPLATVGNVRVGFAGVQ